MVIVRVIIERMKKYIVGIDLGSAHLAGVVGERYADGTYAIVGCATEVCASGVRRGNVYNLNETRVHLSNLLKALERQLDGKVVEKVYVGIGGQSLRTMEHTESKRIKKDAAVTEQDIEALGERCEQAVKELPGVVDVAQVVYRVDGRTERMPIGVPAKELEGRYTLVVGRETICQQVRRCVEAATGIETTGIVVSPLALGDAALRDVEKELGCALVDFGAGVTSVSVYKRGELLHMSVIPLGSELITHDLMSLHVTRTEAERLKAVWGDALPPARGVKSEVIKVEMDGLTRMVKRKELQMIVASRTAEIVENIFARIKAVTEIRSLAAGIVLAGCGANLQNFTELVRDKCKMNVRHATIRHGLLRSSLEVMEDPLYVNAISIMLKGTTSCVAQPASRSTGGSGGTISGGVTSGGSTSGCATADSPEDANHPRQGESTSETNAESGGRRGSGKNSASGKNDDSGKSGGSGKGFEAGKGAGSDKGRSSGKGSGLKPVAGAGEHIRQLGGKIRQMGDDVKQFAEKVVDVITKEN